PEAARAQAEDLGLEQLHLPGLAHLGQHRVARVAQRLLLGHHVRAIERQARALPGREPARHRLDVGVAELVEGARGQRRARAARAVGADPGRLLGDLAPEALLEEAARDPSRAGDVPFGPLVLLADVDQDRAGAVAVPAPALAELDRLADALDVG